MTVCWRLAWRDLRRGGHGLVLLALCLFLGTAALAGIGSLSSSLIAALDAQGGRSLGGDVELAVSQRRATVEERAAFDAAGRTSETISMRAMARAENRTLPVLVDLKGVDDAWPLIGRLRLAAGTQAPRPHGLGVAIDPALADRLDVKTGSPLRIGAATFTVIGLIADEPDRLGAGFTLGPRVLMDMAGLKETRSVQPGSLYTSRYHILLPPGTDAHNIADKLVARFTDTGWQARTSDQASASLKRAIARLGQFLSLVGLAALVIAGVGVGSGVAAYLDGKTQIVATLKVLGASSSAIATVFVMQLAMVALVGIGGGLALGAATPAIVAGLAGDALPVPPRVAIYPQPLLVAAALALLVGALFALPALARARRVPAATLLRGVLSGRRWPSGGVVIAMTGQIAALVALAILSADDRRLAAWFVAATTALLLGLWALGLLIRFAATRIPRPRRPLLRLALGNLHRPGAQTDRLVVAIGLGLSLFVALATIDSSLSAELRGTAPDKAPRLVAIDLPSTNEQSFSIAIHTAFPKATIEAVPSLRGSIVALGDRRVADMKTLPEGAWVLRGDRTITWSAGVPPRNEVVAGNWWPSDYRGPPLVSIEDRAAQALGLQVGDGITVSVLGVDIPTKIAALRRIDWGSLGLNFAIVFSPGYVEEAPHSLIASVYAPSGHDGAMLRTVAETLPSVTLFRVGDLLRQIGDLLGSLATAIRIAASVTIAAGIAVLVGAVAASARARRYDSMVLKMLGATSRQILTVQAIEYLVISFILIIVATAIGSVAGWFVVVDILTLRWVPDWTSVAIVLASTLFVTLGIGIAGSVPALRARPAETLRTA